MERCIVTLCLCTFFCCLSNTLPNVCEVTCNEPLGMESKKIKDHQITASSAFNNDFAIYGPQRARLNLASWPPGYRANPKEARQNWINVDLGNKKVITGLATQGYGAASSTEWVTSYIIMYKSNTGDKLPLTTFQGDAKYFTGNKDSSSVIRHDIPFPVVTSDITILPQAWKDNVGLRLELYGCDPGYFFVVWRMFDSQYFTPNHAISTTDEYIAAKENALAEMRDHLQVIPGFLSVTFTTLSPHRSALGETVLTAEVNIFCLNSSKGNLEAKLNTEITTGNVAFRFPSRCQCSYPQVNISLNKTLAEADVLYTTQNITVHAKTKPGNCHKSIYFQWEIAKASDHTSEFGMFIAQGDVFKNKSGILQLSGSELVEGFLYIRCAAFKRHLRGELVVETYDYGYVRVLNPPLIALISGSTTAIKGNGSVELDASNSYDPIATENNRSGLNFSWFCHRRDSTLTKARTRSCYGQHSERLSSTGSILIVDVDKMDANYTYVFELVIIKDRRVSRAFHALTVSPPYVISLRCIINCGRKVTTNRRLIIQATCSGPFCLQEMSYRWILYQLMPSKTGAPWLKVHELQQHVLTDLDSTNIVFSGSRNPLKQRTKYKIVASARFRDQMAERGEIIFITGSPPHIHKSESGCEVYPKKGNVLKTYFNITCSGWQDEDLPLTYQLSVDVDVKYTLVTSDKLISEDSAIANIAEGLVIIARGNTSNFITMLPQGNQSENYEVKLEAQIFDSLGDATTFKLIVQVEPLSLTETIIEVSKAIYGPNSTTAELLKSGNQQKATLTSLFTLTATEGTGMSLVETNSAKDEVLRHLVVAQPRLLQEVTQLSAVVIKTTQQRKNMTVTSLGNAGTLLQSMTSHLNTEASNSEDVDVIQIIGNGLLNGMSYVLDILTTGEVTDANQTNRLNERDKQETPRMIEESVALMDKLGTALLFTKVTGESEPSVFETNALSMVLDRQTPSMLVSKHLQWKNGGVVFPSQAVLIQSFKFPVHSVDAQMLTFKYNPFYWDNTSKSITSAVVDFSIKRDGTAFHISNLKEPFELYIPLIQQQKQKKVGAFFVKSSKMFENIRYHKITIPSDKAIAIIDIVPAGSNLLKVFIGAGVRPTPKNYSFSSHVPHYGNCRNSVPVTGRQQCRSISRYRLLISSNLTGATGDYYIGILFHGNYSNGRTVNEASTKIDFHAKRQLRSVCNSKGHRKKRFCVEVKDPPTKPPPTPRIIEPTYNLHDVNYTMSVSISSCLYWSNQEQQWTSKGCKVGSKTNTTSLHCLCTHLSAFGGDFFVAPNPIDYDKVWLEFDKLEETGNLVSAVVFSIYGLYMLGLFLARRADKKDQAKVVANVMMSECNQEGYIYEIQIQTGIWKGSGTTANVGIEIFGEEGSSGPIILTDLSLCGKLFSRRSVTNFVIFLPRSLGHLEKLLIWHDNFGQSPSWFLQHAIITESHIGTKWYFFANKWLAVERGSGNILLELKALEDKQRAEFRHLFISNASRSLGDNHLWLSLFTRPPHSPFTLCQRLSCCISFLFLSMVTNAMFYQFSEKPTHTFQLGPLVLSWRQVVIGMQSGLIAIPVNIVIVMIFRNVRVHSEIYSAANPCSTIHKTSFRLPHYFVYIAWTLCILLTLSSSAFTIFYGLSWGKEISNQWLTSIFTSLVGDVVLTQPVKVILLAMIVSLTMRTHPEKEDLHGVTVYANNEQEYNAPNEHELNKAREYGKNFLSMCKIIKDMVVFFVFVHLLMVVCYSNRDFKRFLVTNSVEDILSRFNKVTNTSSFWLWTRNKLVPGLYHVSWYNKQPFNYKEGFISNKEAFLIGMPRLRQTRLKQEKRCHAYTDIIAEEHAFTKCSSPHSTISEDKSAYYQPGWISINNHTVSSDILQLYCPKPWRYQSPQTLQTLPFQGLNRKYDGGGYVAYLGYNEKSAFEIINNLQNNNWIDRFTTAVFIEFSVHQPSSRLFSFVRYLYERLPTGGSVISVDVQTLALYRTTDGFTGTFYEVYQMLFVIWSLILLILEVRDIIRNGKAYFAQFWNWIYILQILTSVSAAVVVVLKAKETSLYVRRVMTNPFDHSSPDRVVRLCYYENYLLAIVIFIASIRLLKLLKLNQHILQMTKTLRKSGRSLISFVAVFANSLLAFSFAGFLAFGVKIKSFSSFSQALGTILQMCVGGNVNLAEVKLQHQVVGPLFMCTFVIWMSFILVNIFVVILVEYYKEVRNNVVSPHASLADFMYTYFSVRSKRLFKSLPLSMKSNVIKRRTKVSKKHWRKSGPRNGALSPALETSFKIPDLEAILPLEDFDSCLSDDICHQVTKSDSIVHCICTDDKLALINNFNSGSMEDWDVKVEDTDSFQSLPFCNNYEQHFKRSSTARLVLRLRYLECVYDLSDLQILNFKSNIVDIALELKRMLADFKKGIA